MLHVQDLKAKNNGLLTQFVTLNFKVCVPWPYHHFFDFQAVWSSWYPCCPIICLLSLGLVDSMDTLVGISYPLFI